MSNHRLTNNSKLDLVKRRFKRCLTIFSWSAIMKKGYSQLKTYFNRCIYTFDKFGTLRIDLTGDEDFRLCFRLRKGSVSDLIKILDIDPRKRMQESYWRLIWCICICCMHSHSQGFQGFCEQKGLFLSFLENPADTKRKKFYDVAHFSSLHFLWRCPLFTTM